MARTFNGSTDVLELADGGADSGFGTWFAIARRASNSNASALISFRQASGRSPCWWTRSNTDGNLMAWFDQSGSVKQTTTLTWTAADGWCFLAATKATGTTVITMHKYVVSSNTWTHEDTSGTSADCAAAAGYRLAAGHNGAAYEIPLNGDMALAGFIASKVLTEAQIESLMFSKASILAAAPTVFWMLDQQAVAQTVADQMGTGANQSSITGTTVATSSVPIFSYGLPIMHVAKQPAAGVGGAAGPRDLLLLGAG